MCVCHRCDVPACVNITHLFLGTAQENQADKVQKARQARGTTNGRATITEDTVRELRRVYAEGAVGYRELARQFGLPTGTVYHIVARRTWKHI